jgi:uncharacterized protein (TIGR02118 family)
MPTLMVLYPTPTDAATFDRRYRDEHAPMVSEHLGMATFKAMRVVGAPGGGPAPYHLVAQLGFESDAAMQAALGAEGGRATAKHAFEISSGGAPVFLVCEDV